jgi:hypothetical protein
MWGIIINILAVIGSITVASTVCFTVYIVFMDKRSNENDKDGKEDVE